MLKTGQQIDASEFIISILAGENLTANDAVYINTSDGKAYKTDATDLTKMDFIGFAQSTTAIGGTVVIVHQGQMTGLSGLTIGARYYLSGTAGAITATAPTNKKNVGVALTATKLKIDQFPTHRVVTFTASGTWTKRPGLKYIRVRLVGGGGGGSGCSSDNEGSAGGSGGGYSEKVIVASDLASTVAVTIGAGGTAGPSGSPRAGGDGGTTSFGSHCSATGGAGSNAHDTGAGGIGSGGDINIDGGQGGFPDTSYSGSESTAKRGFGGASMLSGTVASGAGQNYGGGGSGVDTPNGGSASAGYAGAAGIVIVDEYY